MRISVITATYNSQAFLKTALDSFIAQSYINKELVIVDGKSTDDTLEILASKHQHINTIVSEPDKGIYDALNKGIQLATGDVIGILHSDDFFADENVLAGVKQKFDEDVKLDAVYGDLQYINRENPDKIIRNWISGEYNINNFKRGWMPPHPALFIKKRCFKKFGLYDLGYKSAADYDLILRFLFKHQIETAYLPKVLTKMRVGGLSNRSFKNRLNANREDRMALEKNGVPNPLLVSVLKPLSKIGQFWNKNF
ncbi:glycosyltransferase family 2 protein [Pelobium manganitolerans]|uniref:glycosyltransferase family 2 protein n=1 Tax=Pelobium manganitolerans TaxID=1842495 RepID=UPI003FA3D244